MLKLGTALLLATTLTTPALAAAVPQLSGSYVYTANEICPGGGGSLYQATGTAKFDPAAGSAKLDFYASVGNGPELLRVRSTQTYSNTATALSLGANTYHIVYGPVQNGVATAASFIGLVKDGASCSFQGAIALQ
jgi:hypothetical protein